jgi:hypothetical protein
MRLSGWRKTAPAAQSMKGEVLAILPPVLANLGAEADPECWVAWGDDPHVRYSVLVPTMAGLAVAAVRPAGPQGAARISAKLIRWSKLAISELAIDSTGGHRIVAVQVDAIVLKGVDDEVDRICEFVRGLIAEVDDRNSGRIPAAVREAQVRTVAAPDVETVAGTGIALAGAAVAPLAEPETEPVPEPEPEPEPPEAEPEPEPPEPAPEPPEAEPDPPEPEPEPAALPPASGQADPEVVVDRSRWVPPHPIEATAPRKSRRPRSWKP